jgi:hypothetical protein
MPFEVAPEELLVEHNHAAESSAGNVRMNWRVTISTASAIASAETRPW